LDPLRLRRVSAYRAGPGLEDALAVSRLLGAHGLASTIGYAAGPSERARVVADVHLAAFDRLSAEDLDCQVSVRAHDARATDSAPGLGRSSDPWTAA
jgi:hypothetical protein